MRLCFDCLLDEDPRWGHRYRMVWLAIVIWGGGAFALPLGPLAIPTQGLFFLATFGWSLWPLFAARRPTRTSQRMMGQKRTDRRKNGPAGFSHSREA